MEKKMKDTKRRLIKCLLTKFALTQDSGITPLNSIAGFHVSKKRRDFRSHDLLRDTQWFGRRRPVWNWPWPKPAFIKTQLWLHNSGHSLISSEVDKIDMHSSKWDGRALCYLTPSHLYDQTNFYLCTWTKT